MILLILLAGFAVMQAVEVRRITRERDRADRIAEFMTGIFKVSDPNERLGGTVTAGELLDKAAKDIDTGLSKDPELQTKMMHVMGRAYMNLGLYPRAESLFERGIQVSSVAGREDRETLNTVHDLAWTLLEEGRDSEAESLERKTLASQLRLFGPDDRDTLGTMGELAFTLCQENRCAEGVKLNREVLEKQKRILGPEAFYTLVTMNNLAIMLGESGQPAEAEKLEQQAYSIQLRVFGAENLGTINSMLNLADIKRELHQDQDAVRLFRQILEIEARVMKPDQPEMAATKYDLATVLVRNGQFDEAFSLLNQAVDHGLPPRMDLDLEKDEWFNPLRGDARFTALVTHAKQRATQKAD